MTNDLAVSTDLFNQLETPVGTEAEFAPLPQAHIEILTGNARYPIRPIFNPLFLIGSGADCDLVLASPNLAEIHSCLALTENGITWKCLVDTPLPQISGRDVRVAGVNNGDIVRLADFEFKIHLCTTEAARDEWTADAPTSEYEFSDGVQTPFHSESRPRLRLFVEPE